MHRVPAVFDGAADPGGSAEHAVRDRLADAATEAHYMPFGDHPRSRTVGGGCDQARKAAYSAPAQADVGRGHVRGTAGQYRYQWQPWERVVSDKHRQDRLDRTIATIDGDDPDFPLGELRERPFEAVDPIEHDMHDIGARRRGLLNGRERAPDRTSVV